MAHRIAVLVLLFPLAVGTAAAGDRQVEFATVLAFLESLEPAGQALCADPELPGVYGTCRVWITLGGRYHYFLMLRRKEPWKVWRVPTEGVQKPEVRWRASEGCSDDAVCA